MKNTTLMLLATTILSAVAMQANAAPLKEPEAQFYPAKSWIVGNGATPADCVVQSEFNNGFVLRFEGTQDWVQSFSINFRQNIFMADNTYNVTLSVPGKVSKQFSAAAADMTTLSLRADKDIYQFARDNSVLDVTIDDNSFRFFLVNFAAAAGKFETCMAGGDIHTGPAPAVSAAPQPVSAPEPLEPAPAAVEPQHVSAPEPLEPPPVAREVSNSIPQGAMAPPPPNADNIDAIASLNESIEFEEREAANKGNVAITEILPEDPKPTMQKIPYTETVKLGNEVIMKDGKDVESPAAAATAAAAPYRKRMSEQLAQEMATNPSTASILEGGNSQAVTPAPVETAKAEPLAPIGRPDNRQEPMAVPPTIEESISQPPAAQPIAQEEPEAPAPTIAWSSPPPSPPPSATPSPAPAPVAAAPTPQPAPGAAPLKISSGITPEQARAMAAAQQAGQPVGLVQQIQPAQVQPALARMQPIKQAKLAPLPSLQPASSHDASPDEPFAQRGEIIKTDKLSSADRSAAPDPILPPPPGLDEPVRDEFVSDEPPAPVSNVKRIETPEMTVHKQTYQATADFTDSGEDLPPVLQSGEPKMRRKADPEMLMKISQLEKKINELEKENSAIQSNMSSSQQEAVSIETDNWNLERATARYNEAERQIKRLGEQLQRERALRVSEKKDLEAQLFDPQITEQQQLARLAELEQKLDEAESRLEQQRIRYEERIRSTQQPGARDAVKP